MDQVFVSNPSHIIGSASERDRRNYYCRKKLTAAKKVSSVINKTLNWVTLFFILCSVSNEELQNIYQPSYINVLFVIMMLWVWTKEGTFISVSLTFCVTFLFLAFFAQFDPCVLTMWLQTAEAFCFIVYVLAHSFVAHWRVCGLQMKQQELIIDGPKCVEGRRGGTGGYSAYLSGSLLTAHFKIRWDAFSEFPSSLITEKHWLTF